MSDSNQPSERAVTLLQNDGTDIEQQEQTVIRGAFLRKQKKVRNVLTRMKDEYPAGPLSVLRQCVENRVKVKVWTRNYKHARGICNGYVVAFDKHWNLGDIGGIPAVDKVYMQHLEIDIYLLLKTWRTWAMVDVEETYLNPVPEPATKCRKKRIRNRPKKEKSEASLPMVQPDEEISERVHQCESSELKQPWVLLSGLMYTDESQRSGQSTRYDNSTNLLSAFEHKRTRRRTRSPSDSHKQSNSCDYVTETVKRDQRKLAHNADLWDGTADRDTDAKARIRSHTSPTERRETHSSRPVDPRGHKRSTFSSSECLSSKLETESFHVTYSSEDYRRGDGRHLSSSRHRDNLHRCPSPSKQAQHSSRSSDARSAGRDCSSIQECSEKLPELHADCEDSTTRQEHNKATEDVNSVVGKTRVYEPVLTRHVKQLFLRGDNVIFVAVVSS